MIRQFMEQNVYDALQDRLKFIFEEFDNIYISFSGGKDSGLLLNLVLEYHKKNYPKYFFSEIKPFLKSKKEKEDVSENHLYVIANEYNKKDDF